MLYDRRLDSECKEIRLLKLVIDNGDVIRCELKHASLDDKPDYTALSYVWGDATITRTIFVNGEPFEATVNLEQALRDCRKDLVGQNLWVDAICINQNDIEERNQQVQLMPDLYADATYVLIWLGPTNLAMDMLVEAMSFPADHHADLIEEDEFYLYKRGVLFVAISKWPWWKRVWVVQECVLAQADPTIRCGPHTVPWSSFFDFFTGYYRQAEELGIGDSFQTEARQHISDMANLLGLDNYWEEQDTQRTDLATLSAFASVRSDFKRLGSFPLSGVIAVSLGRRATISHDYIYGFLGLMAPSDRDVVEVDYAKPHWEIYRSFVEELLANEEDQDGTKMFSMLSFTPGSDDSPTWVADLPNQSMFHPDGGMFLVMDDSWRFPPELWFSDDNEILMLRGVLLSEGIATLDLPTEQKDFMPKLSEIADLASIAVKDIVERPTWQHLRMTHVPHLRRMFTGNNAGRGNIVSDQHHLDKWWDVVTDLSFLRNSNHPSRAEYFGVASHSPREELDGLSVNGLIGKLAAAVLLTCAGKKLLISRGGHIGITTFKAQPQDQLVYLYGFFAPFLLRPGNGHYTIVGPVRIAGLENATSLAEHCLSQNAPEATFRIR